MTPAEIARLRLHNQQIAHLTLRTFRGSGFNLTPGGVGQRQPLV